MSNFVEMPEATLPLVKDSLAPAAGIASANSTDLHHTSSASQLLPTPESMGYSEEMTDTWDTASLANLEPFECTMAQDAVTQLLLTDADSTNPNGDRTAGLSTQTATSQASTPYTNVDALLNGADAETETPLFNSLYSASGQSSQATTAIPEGTQQVEYSSSATAPIRIEAEDMDYSGYRLESTGVASEGQILSLLGQKRWETGTATAEFTGSAGDYDVVIGYFDETDGQAQLQVSHNNSRLERWTLDQALGSSSTSAQNIVRRTVAQGLSLDKGDTLQIKGFEKQDEHARIDYIEFIPNQPDAQPAPASKAETGDRLSIDTDVTPKSVGDDMPSKPATPITQEPIRVEAETMTQSGYRLESTQAASGGSILSLRGKGKEETATATTQFSGPNGDYDVVIGYFDENDGQADLQVSHNNSQLERWTLDQNLGSSSTSNQNSVRRTVAKGLSLEDGDTFEIKGFEKQEEHARIDYIEFIPSSQSAPDSPNSGADAEPDVTPSPSPDSDAGSDKPPTPKAPSADDVDDAEPDDKPSPKPKSEGEPTKKEESPDNVAAHPTSKSRSRGNLLFEDGFENGLSKDWRREDHADKSYSLTFADAPGRSGKAARFELHKDDPWVSSSKRSELVGDREPAGAERWYGFSTYLPSDWKTDSGSEIITQWHATRDKHLGEDSRNPPLGLHVDGDQMVIKTTWDSNRLTTKSSKQSEVLWRGSYDKGEWDDWVFHVDWSHQSDGLIRVWRDDELIVDRKGPNTYNDDVGGYLKTGIYKYSWKRNPERSNTNQRVLYVDNVRIGDGNASYSDVDPT